MKRADFYKLPEIVQRYLLNYLSAVKNYSELTISEYAGNLYLFFRFLAQQKNISREKDISSVDVSELEMSVITSVTLSDVYAFIDYCRSQRKNGEAARARKIICIKRFYRYLLNQGIIDKNPLAQIDTPKMRKSLPKYLSVDESVDLLKSVDGKYKERDYCILTLFLNCGLRLSELVRLDYTDIRPDRSLRILGKGNKERIIYLNDACIKAIESYLAVRPNAGFKGEDKNALFISRNNRRISGRAVENIVKSYLEKTGLANQGYSPHKLRHTAATLMYQKGGVDILLIKEILGHENLSTTQIYTHTNTNQIKTAMESNPLGSVSPSSKKNEK